MDTTDFLDRATGANTETAPNLESTIGFQFPFLDGEKDILLAPQEAPEAGNPEQGTEFVSQEGFMDTLGKIKDFFVNRKPSVSNMSGGWFDRTSVVRKTLGNTYLNPQWLARRKFVQGNINVAKFLAPISDNGGWGIETIQLNADDFHETVLKVITAYGNHTDASQRALGSVVEDLPNSVNDLSYHEALRVERALYHFDDDFTYSFKSKLGGAMIVKAKHKCPSIQCVPTSVVNIPALDQAGVLVACNAILKIAGAMDELNAYWERYINTPIYTKIATLAELDEGYIEHKTDSHVAYLDEDLQRVWENIFDQLKFVDFEDLAVFFRHCVLLMKCYARLIDLSVR